jgi:hypothetical protein
MEQRAVLYPPDRAIELASNVSGLIPVRLFALLYPLWLVEIDAHEETRRPYALIEQFIERGIQEAHLRSVQEMVDFFGLSTSLVTKVLHFLATIQHIQQVDGRWILTERGEQSLLQGVKSEIQEKGQYIYFDGFCSKPLTQDHYHKNLHIISDLEAKSITRTAAGGHQFYRLHTSEMWNIRALRDLVNNPDRAKYNLPQELRAVTTTSYALVYMPMYIIETKRQRLMQPYYLVYTHIKDQRDAFFEHIVNKTLSIQRALDAMPKEENLAEIWSRWLRSDNMAYLRPEQTREGLWRVNLPETLFPSSEYPLRKIGTYYKEKGYFLQLWCNNDILRRQAIFDRALYLVTKNLKTIKRKYIEDRLQQWSELFAVASVHVYELYSWAREHRVEGEVLQKLASWREDKAT